MTNGGSSKDDVIEFENSTLRGCLLRTGYGNNLEWYQMHHRDLRCRHQNVVIARNFQEILTEPARKDSETASIASMKIPKMRSPINNRSIVVRGINSLPPLAGIALTALLVASGCGTNAPGKTPAASAGNGGSGGKVSEVGGAGAASGGTNAASAGSGGAGTTVGGSSAQGGSPPVGGSGGTPAESTGGGGSPAQAGLAPAGNACPAGPFSTPLTGNVAATLVRGDLGGELEGPAWLASQKALYFTQAGGGNANGKINRYTPADDMLTTFVSKVGVGGLAVDTEGKLLAASYDKRSITRFDPTTMQRTDVAGGASFDGKPFNEVNDLVMRSDGNIYFSDPQYDSVPPGTEPMAFYRLSPPPESKVTLVLEAKGANGVALSPDGAYLYLGTTEAGGGPVRRLALNADGSIKGAATDWKESSSDGMAMDCAGNLYISIDNQIRVLSPSDQVLGNITGLGNGYVTNSAFGDADQKTLYITTDTSLYKARLNVPGFPN
jgi:gluconolactonase